MTKNTEEKNGQRSCHAAKGSPAQPSSCAQEEGDNVQASMETRWAPILTVSPAETARPETTPSR